MKKRMFAVRHAQQQWCSQGTAAVAEDDTYPPAGREDRSDHHGFYRPALDQPE